MCESPARHVRNVIFDIGRVLYQWDIRHLFKKLIADPQELDWFCANVVTFEWHSQTDQGRDLDDMIPERVALFPDHEHLIRTYRERWLETIPGPIPGMHQLVRGLHRRDIPLYAITNFGSEFWQLFRPTAPVFDLFRDIVVSGDEKLAKPDHAIFTLATERFRVCPDQSLFIDDNAANIAAAKELGFATHHFSCADALGRELIDYGLVGPDDLKPVNA